MYYVIADGEERLIEKWRTGCRFGKKNLHHLKWRQLHVAEKQLELIQQFRRKAQLICIDDGVEVVIEQKKSKKPIGLMAFSRINLIPKGVSYE